MKNPTPLAMKDKIVKVSVLSQRKRCDTGAARYIGSTNCTHYSVEPRKQTVEEQHFTNNFDNKNCFYSDALFMSR